MNKKTILLVLSVLALLILAGCQPVDSGNSFDSTKRYNGGDEGLKINFIEGEPPRIVLDDNQETFDLALLVENVGEEDIRPGDVIVTLNGIERDAFKLRSLTEKNENEILGIKKLGDRIQGGENDEIRFNDANYQESLPFDFEVDVRADVCYEYGTTTVADVCLKSKASERLTDDQCDIDNSNINYENSGAPVHVENFIQNARGSDQIQFTFDVVKRGSGEVYPSGNFKDKCTVDRDNDDKVNIKVDFLSRSQLRIDCPTFNGAEGTIRLIDGRKTVRCLVNTGSLQDIAFERPLRIKLDYMYKDNKEVNFRVESTEDF